MITLALLALSVTVATEPPVPPPAVSARVPERGAFIEMFVAGVVPTSIGHTLVLVNPDEKMLLPMGIGLSEALSIRGRLADRQFERPMTHDLMDGILHTLGGELLRVQIDDVKDDVFVGTVFIKSNGRVVAIDARPSDAVALALKSKAPIFVARVVMRRAALHASELEPAHGEADEEDDDGEPPQLVPSPGVLTL